MICNDIDISWYILANRSWSSGFFCSDRERSFMADSQVFIKIVQNSEDIFFLLCNPPRPGLACERRKEKKAISCMRSENI